MKNAKVVSSIASNKPDGLSIALIVILVLIIVICILWYMFYKPTKIVRQQTEEFENGFKNERFFQKNNIGKEVPTDPVHVQVDVLEGSLMTAEQINDYFGSTKKKRQ